MTRRDEIFEVLCQYASDHLGNSPSSYDLLAEMQKRGYTFSRSALRKHLDKLTDEQRLERRDGKLVVVRSNWTPPE